MARTAPTLLPLLLLTGLLGCRESKTAGFGTLAFDPSPVGANGCSGPDQVFAPGQVPVAVPLAALAIGPMSQVTAAADAELLYATGDNATLVALDFGAGSPPLETELLTAGAGAVAALLAPFGVATAPVLSGLAVLDAGALVVMEHTSNTLIAVSRTAPDTVALFAGVPSEAPGFADGPALGQGAARFHFAGPSQVAPLAGGDVVVADAGNHAVRLVSGGAVFTLSGTGSAFFADGDLGAAGFDTPSGLSVSCTGQLLITERGGNGAGHRLRQLMLGASGPFGLTGTVMTRAGMGLDGTMQGDGEDAWLGAPSSPLVTSADDIYWIDGTMGILRRLTGPADTVDCPLFATCADAVAMGGNFSDALAGGTLSLTQTPAGVLFVLDTSAGALLRVSP